MIIIFLSIWLYKTFHNINKNIIIFHCLIIFFYIEKHLSSGGGILKKGSLLLIYSDISANLGLQEKDRIKNLCLENNMMIVDSFQRDFEDDSGFNTKIDPLIKFKTDSKIIFYEIMKN